MSSVDWRDAPQWVVTAAAVLAALGVIYRIAVRPIVRAVRELVAVIGPDDDGRTLLARVAEIERRSEQLQPNGGGSVADRVAQIPALRDAVDQLAGRLDEHITGAAGAERDMRRELAEQVAEIASDRVALWRAIATGQPPGHTERDRP